jgi:hypothetical protein
MIVKALIKSGLYDISETIDICVLSSNFHEDLDIRLPKFNIHIKGDPVLYERPTLLHLHEKAKNDNDEVYYWYLHTKGLRWFGTSNEQNVVDWINLLLFWNVYRWKDAVEKLDRGFEVYGCNQTNEPVNHYSGNFWWTKSSYLKRLPNVIGPEYNDPEFWIMKENPKWLCIFRSGLEGMGHYSNRYDRSLYEPTQTPCEAQCASPPALGPTA